MRKGKIFNLKNQAGSVICTHMADTYKQAILAFTRFLVGRKEPLSISDDQKSFTIYYRKAQTTFFVEME